MLGFYVCTADLEDELIRAAGPTLWSRSSRRRASCGPSASSSNSPLSGGAAPPRSFTGSWAPAPAKSQYARLLAGALDLTRIPRPLDCVRTHA
jgi:hypothetical protein